MRQQNPPRIPAFVYLPGGHLHHLAETPAPRAGLGFRFARRGNALLAAEHLNERNPGPSISAAKLRFFDVPLAGQW